MKCWKSINVEKHYGNWHLVYLSLIVTVISFILLYIPFSFLADIHSFNNEFLFFFILFGLLTYPAHKFVHVFSLWLLGATFRLNRIKEKNLLQPVKVIVSKPLVK